jgi:hypothetical protein
MPLPSTNTVVTPGQIYKYRILISLSYRIINIIPLRLFDYILLPPRNTIAPAS